MLLRGILVFLFLLLSSSSILAIECSAIFPGDRPFAKHGSISYDLKENVKCNGSNDCGLETISSTVSPVIPNGGNNQGQFNQGSLSDQAYNYFSSWKSSRKSVSIASGTAVLYFDGNGNDINIPENATINSGGNPSKLLIVITDGKLIVGKNSVINAYIYTDTEEVKFEEGVEFSGAITVTDGSFIVEKDSEYNFITPSNSFDSHGYCTVPVLASCPDVFPAGYNQATSSNEKLSNFPTNSSNTTLSSTTTLARGDNFYLDSVLDNNDEITVAAISGSETTARLYLRAGVLWHNVKINQSGNPEDLIVVIDGALQLSGDDTLINAIIYVKGTVGFTGAGTVNGAITSEGAGSGSAIYDASAISNADFNGMCAYVAPAAPLANYRFDECSYSGLPAEAIDQIGSYSATSYGDMALTSYGAIERSAYMTKYDQHFQTSIPLPASYSVATWFKKPTDTTGSEYFVLGSMSTGNDLLYLDRTKGWIWGVHHVTLGFVDGTYSFASLDSNWHHLALVYDGGVTQLYIDGSLVDSVSRVPDGTLKYIGTSFDNVNTVNAQGFRAPLDEFVVFDSALTASEITSVFNNQTAGNNWDGTSRATVSCITLQANYQLDECSYTGATNEVLDVLNTYHGTVFGGANSLDVGKIERAIDTTDYSHHIETNIPLSNAFSVSTWFKKPTATTGSEYFVLGAMSTGGDLLYLDRTKGWIWGVHNLTLGFVDGTYSFASLDNNWHHLTLVYDAGITQLYIDGSLVDSVSRVPEGTLKYIGTSFDHVNTVNAQGFRAPLDEFLVFNNTLSASEIATIYNNQAAGNNWDASTRTATACTSINHFQIIHDGTALTCEAETVTIKACTNVYDGSCTESSDAVTLNVKATGSPVVTDNITFTGNGTASLSYTTAEAVTLSIDGPSIAPTNATVCNDNSAGSCELVYDNTGFQFLSESVSGVVSSTIATQLSGKPSNTGFNSATLSLQAIKTSSITGACEAAIVSNVVIELAAKCENPNTCASQSVVINSTAIPTLANADTLSYGNVSLDFGSNAKNTAEFTFNYPDAGKVQLYARYNIPVDGSPSGDYMAGNSNSFVVRPLGFYIDIPDNVAATVHDGGIFKKAGENFTTTITAMAWGNGDDGNSDGQPENNNELSNNTPTPNFSNEISPESVEVNHELVLPSGGNNPALSIKTFSDFSNGVSLATEISWPEVGIISFNVSNQYIDSDDVIASLPYIGRFTPNHFEVSTVLDGALNGGGPFVYIGQMNSITPANGQISYLVEPEFSITAKSAQCPAGVCTTTKNYTGDFLHMQASDIYRLTPTSDVVTLGKDGITKVKLIADLNTVSLTDSNGVISYQYNSSDNYVYTRETNALINKFTADIDLQITSISDDDGITANDTDTEVANGILTLHPLGIELRFGRWYIPNTYGSEREDLSLPMFIQYWNGSKFVTNTIDDSTTFDGTISANYTLNNTGLSPALNPLVTDVNGAGPSFIEGAGELILQKPSDSSRGQIRLTYDTVPSWLKYDWDDDGAFDDNPSAIATFGLFRGNDRIISWREVGN